MLTKKIKNMKKPTLRKGAIINITARRWFDKRAGNTYHSVHVYVKSGTLEAFMDSPRTYGYGEQYLQTALGLVWERFIPCKGCQSNLPEVPARLAYFWGLKEWYKINVTVSDVPHMKDLNF